MVQWYITAGGECGWAELGPFELVIGGGKEGGLGSYGFGESLELDAVFEYGW